ncbi:hypothetical protein QN362_11675 [Actimicrobium sp. CCC2.4]|uniref:hypothetical protein n=1 Tax=Actimicrobium sp. CCC2.4 TaxID=3048606 RepID=UPI002AC91B6D|nr:hypothetical protein [Actimicrobium sp. CCC2.4]MEB0135989.1 hypothetical protein [Actimicrobium sp. CCC2.4]WPX32652.1 hypothetical protein RHM62_02035 [Actimicrobium sp. CCC2.4]
MTKHLVPFACLLLLAACQSMSPSETKPLTPSAGVSPPAMDSSPVTPSMTPEPIAPGGVTMPPDVGTAGPMVGPK